MCVCVCVCVLQLKDNYSFSIYSYNFFYILNTRILLFLVDHYAVKTDIVMYYLLPTSAVLKL